MTTDGRRFLILSIGPVQGFVEQARRTRDLWAGSFLLSWLTGHAMKVVLDGGGRIVVPAVNDDPMFRTIMDPTIEETPFIGSLPNLFTAEISDGFDPKACERAVREAWTKLGNAVWDAFVAPVADMARGGQTSLRALWDAQMKAFWSIVWVTVPAGTATGNPLAEAGRFLAMRKAWRSHLPLDETKIEGRERGHERGGDHCQMMGDWLELSGWVRSIPEEKNKQAEKEKQTAFWEALRNKTKTNPGDSDTLELAEGERLCAIALVKRLFPILPEDSLASSIGWVPSGSRDRIRQWPSTRAMAAVPWLMEAETHTESAQAFYDLVGQKAPLYRNTVAERNAYLHLGRTFGVLGQLDGGLFFEAALQNPRDFKVASNDEITIRKDLLRARYNLVEAVGIGEPSPYYALLLMDGDSCGALIQELGAEVVTALFNAFTDKVADIVKRHHGACIYAGGDDVLAMLPLTTALGCARDLREAYREAAQCVAEEKAEPDLAARGTISAAIVFAEATVPLRLGLERVRTGLKDRAKGLNGRNSLSVEILQPGGMSRDWVSSWESNGPAAFATLIEKIAKAPGAFASARFLYVLGQRYGAAYLPLFEPDTEDAAGIERGDVRKVLIKEYLDNTTNKPKPGTPEEVAWQQDVGARMDLLLDVLVEVLGGVDGAVRGARKKRPRVNAQVGPILRFLAREGRWPVNRDTDPQTDTEGRHG